MTAITVEQVANAADLFAHFSGQHEPQDAYIALSLADGRMWANYNAEIGNGVPESVYSRRTLRWTIPPLTAEAANRLMGEIAPLAQTLLAGAEVVWDGNNNVGRLTSEARAIVDQIDALCAAYHDSDDEVIGGYDAGDWWSEGDKPNVTAQSTDAELDAIAREAEAEALAFTPPMVLEGADEYLRDLRAELLAEIDA